LIATLTPGTVSPATATSEILRASFAELAGVKARQAADSALGMTGT